MAQKTHFRNWRGKILAVTLVLATIMGTVGCQTEKVTGAEAVDSVAPITSTAMPSVAPSVVKTPEPTPVPDAKMTMSEDGTLSIEGYSTETVNAAIENAINVEKYDVEHLALHIPEGGEFDLTAVNSNNLRFTPELTLSGDGKLLSLKDLLLASSKFVDQINIVSSDDLLKSFTSSIGYKAEGMNIDDSDGKVTGEMLSRLAENVKEIEMDKIYDSKAFSFDTANIEVTGNNAIDAMKTTPFDEDWCREVLGIETPLTEYEARIVVRVNIPESMTDGTGLEEVTNLVRVCLKTRIV